MKQCRADLMYFFKTDINKKMTKRQEFFDTDIKSE
jgi:hypothetical protein